MLWRLQPGPRSCATIGWTFGTGYFAAVLFWIVEPFQVDAAQHGWMAPFALVFLSAGLALFWALAFWTARRVSNAAFGLVFAWAGAEVLRAYVLTGFPWGSPAQALIDGPASRLLAAFGPHGTTLVMMLFAWSLSVPANGRDRVSLRGGQIALLCGIAAALYLPLAQASAILTDHWVRLVQPNAAQHLKWQPDMVEVFFRRQLEYTAAPPARPEETPDLIVWPETAIPWPLESAGPALDAISEASGGTAVSLGMLRFDEAGPKNALVVLEQDGSPDSVYEKHHLVPFGEYMPLRKWADRFGLQALAASAGSFSKGPGPAVLDFGALGKGMPLICYEAVFAHEVNAAAERPDFLIQVTNDAWFGELAGPQQHMAQARMRAIEQGLPLMRAANTGISAMVDPYGRIVSMLPLNTAGFLDAPLPRPLNATLYSRVGDWPAIAFAFFGLIALALRGRT